MSEHHDGPDPGGALPRFSPHLSVAAVALHEPLGVGQRIHIRGHTTDLVQTVVSMEVDHRHVERAGPGDDVALKVDDHVREHDLLFREP